jgi:hypothetical protein
LGLLTALLQLLIFSGVAAKAEMAKVAINAATMSRRESL